MRNTTYLLAMSMLVFSYVCVAQAQVTVTSSTATTCVVFNRNLFYGISDTRSGTTDVRQLQEFLISKNYLNGDSATGFFGNATLQGVKYYQGEKNIETTGYVGALTRNAIFADTCSNSGDVVISLPTTTTSTPVIQPVYVPSVTPQNTLPIYSVNPNYYNKDLVVRGFSVRSGPVGTAVVISGSGFDRYNNTVIFGKQAISGLTSADNATIVFVVPDPAGTCATYSPTGCNVSSTGSFVSADNTYTVLLVNSKGVSNPTSFKITGNTVNVANRAKPSIYDAGGPDILGNNVAGIWAVSVDGEHSGSFTLSANWGDGTGDSAKRLYITEKQTTTFSHTYTKDGTFTIKFTLVDDETGKQTDRTVRVKISASVLVDTNKDRVDYIIPKEGRVGTQIMLRGSGFTSFNNKVYFGPGVIDNVSSYANGSLLFITIPSTINPCDGVTIGTCVSPTIIVNPGTYTMYVENGNGKKSNNINVKVLAP